MIHNFEIPKKHIIGILEADSGLMIDSEGQLTIRSLCSGGFAINYYIYEEDNEFNYEETFEDEEVSKAVEIFLSFREYISHGTVYCSTCEKSHEDEERQSLADGFYKRAQDAYQKKMGEQKK